MMAVAAFVAWLLTAFGGFVLLGMWAAKGGARQGGSTHLPPPVVFGHFLLAAAGLVVWIIHLVVDSTALAWTAFALLLPVALLGFFMFFRWLPTYRGRAAGAEGPAERHFPLPAVAAHGIFAVATVVLVLLTALGA
ncbi:hypothetical protein NDR87_06395 [Nocardia sp. CDC159]|uniref:Uncharacterized protein n=1 Tax=Nocardia pulmonis TaxID=2951408 RepID=A0A9X2E259_9NOCA|nr:MULTISPECIES: hypothetical protein [Nocardia]MCM6772712.1 hypothetical protein [Nocardia pulmonis]MCM6785985.1 hypothetical protein [Nocardia sp. CDC159]